tara:strand:+ start:97 stop:336 length:240 start_codon:yes stop_codon:yes gene_type:complete
MKEKQHTPEEEYNKAGEALVDWVEQCEQRKIEPAMCAGLMLSSAIDLCFHLIGPDKAMTLVDALVREQIKKESEKHYNN